MTENIEGCAPDCAERADCDEAGELGHIFCGKCNNCGLPIHHCANAC